VKIEAATVLVVILGSLGFFLLFVPLVVVLVNLPRVWKRSRRMGAFLAGIVLLTGVFFILFIAGLLAITVGAGS